MSKNYIIFFIIFLSFSLFKCTSHSQLDEGEQKQASKLPRVLITSDMSTNKGDPDDKQSLGHLLMYANEVDIEGIIPDRFSDIGFEAAMEGIAAYEKDFFNPQYNFQKLAYPHPDTLRKLVPSNPKAAIEMMIKSAKKEDARPLHVLVWGNMKVIRDALFEAPEIVSKIRIYTIGTNLMAQNPDAAENSKSEVEYGKRINWNGPGRNDIFNDPRFKDLWWLENDWGYNGMFEGEEPAAFLLEIKEFGELGYYIWECVQAKAWAHYFRAGDTPSLLYLLEPGVDINDPSTTSWAGKFTQAFPEIRPNYWIDDAGNENWNYEDPSLSWDIIQEVYNYRVQNLVKARAGMYDAYRLKMRRVYNDNHVSP